MEEHLSEINRLLQVANKEYSEGLLAILEENGPHGKLSNRIRDRVSKIVNENSAFNLIHTDDTSILTFIRPKPIEAWWWKGGDKTKSGKKSKGWIDGNCVPEDGRWGAKIGESTQKAIVNGNVIEWGYYYRESMVITHKIRDELIEKLKKLGIKASRINRQKDHNDRRGYYIYNLK